MITSLEIQNFRGLKNVVLSDLRRVNLLVGGNDTGKTSILEVLVLLLGDSRSISELPTTFRNNQANGQGGNYADDCENYWLWLFYGRDPANTIKVVAKSENVLVSSLASVLVPEGAWLNAVQIPEIRRSDSGKAFETLLNFKSNALQPGVAEFANGIRVSRLSVRPTNPVEDAERYNQIALEADGEARMEQIMKEVEPRLKRLRYAKLPGTTSPLVFADLGLSRAIPATQMGQAFNRILHIYGEILATKANVLLIDEIENGIFSDSLPLIWKGLLTMCERENVQIFATTHSRECLMAAHAVAKEREHDELSVQRLQLVNGQVEAVRLGAEHLELASEMGLEVRS